MSPCSFRSKTPSYLSISIIVDRNYNKIRHVLGMRVLICKELWVIHNFSHVFWDLFQRAWSTYAIFKMLQMTNAIFTMLQMTNTLIKMTFNFRTPVYAFIKAFKMYYLVETDDAGDNGPDDGPDNGPDDGGADNDGPDDGPDGDTDTDGDRRR